MNDGLTGTTQKKFVSDMGPDRILVRVHIPTINEKKVIDAPQAITVWYMKKILCLRVETETQNLENYGFYLPNCSQFSKPGKWLRESQKLSSYFRGTLATVNHELDLLFIPKARYVDKDEIERYASQNTKRHRKRFLSYVTKGLVSKVKRYCDNGFDPNFKGENGEIPLMIATMNEDSEMILTLLEGGAFVDYRLGIKQNYLSALHLAAANSKISSLKTLVKCGAWIDMEDHEQRTPLFHAVLSGNPKTLVTVLLLNPDINHKDSREWTALHLACVEKDGISALLLIDNGIDMNAKNSVGNTPLHVAAANGADVCIDCLLSRGCDKDVVNKSGQTATQIATLSGNVRIKQKIMEITNELIIPPPPKPIYRDHGVVISSQDDIVKPINIDRELIMTNILRNLTPRRVSYTPSIASVSSTANNASIKTIASFRSFSVYSKHRDTKESGISPLKSHSSFIIPPPPKPINDTMSRTKQASSLV